MKDLFRKTKLLFLTLILLLISNLQGISQKGLTLDEALKIAEANSPTMKKTMLSLVRSQENLNAQKAALKSQFSLKLSPFSYTHQNEFNDYFSNYNLLESKESGGLFTIMQPIIWTDATLSLNNDFGYTDSYSRNDRDTSSYKGFSNKLTISLNQPIFTYNRTKLQLKELQLNLENTQLNYATQLLSLERSVAQSFYNVYQKQQSLEIARQAFENMQKSYEVSKNKVDAGLSAREEIFQAELNLASAKSDYENAQVLFENAKDEFKLLIGLSLYDDVIVLANIAVDTVTVDPAFAIDQGLANRMELRQRKIDIETSQFDLIQTKALNEFKGSIELSVGLFGDNEKFKDIYANTTDNERVSLTLDIPLWDWGERKSRIKASEAIIETSKISLEEEQNDIIINIRKVYRNLLNLQNQIGIARQNVTNAQLTYDLNLERYKNGDLLNLKIQTLYDFEKKAPVSPVMSMKK
ncbi:MAG: TolC family protein [Bacteroidia bacterium]|nr:TolC family protein [Bacteroidia bacterium]